MPAEGIWALVLWLLWAIMFIFIILTSRMLYAEAVRRGQNAELWILINVIAGLSGLSLILMSFLTSERGVWLFTITGSLLVILGPLIYLALPKHRGGGGAGQRTSTPS